MKYSLAIDIGASSGRHIVGWKDNGELQTKEVYRFLNGMTELNGHLTWDIEALLYHVKAGIAAAKKCYPVESLSIDTWGVDFACVAKDGTLSLPRAYRDPYTDGIPEKFFRKMPREELYRRTGIQIMNLNSVFQLYAQHKEGSEALENAKAILFMPDAVSYLLTGKKVCEYTILSTSALMDPRTKKIDKDILDVCHVKSKRFPSIVYPGDKVGKLSPELAEKTGLGKVNVIAVAGHDTGSAVAAVPALSEGFAYLSSGTWSLMGIETKEPVINEKMYQLNFTNEGGVGGTTRLLKNITGMWLLEQCLVKWRSEDKNYSYPEIARLASECEKSADLIDPDAPEFASPTDMPAAICKYCRDHGFEEPADDAHIMRLIYDSLAGKYAEVFHNLEAIAPFKIEALHIIGGGSQNELLDQMTADACGVTVVAGPAEGTALGNVMIQAKLSRKDINKFIDTKIFKPSTK